MYLGFDFLFYYCIPIWLQIRARFYSYSENWIKCELLEEKRTSYLFTKGHGAISLKKDSDNESEDLME